MAYLKPIAPVQTQTQAQVSSAITQPVNTLWDIHKRILDLYKDIRGSYIVVRWKTREWGEISRDYELIPGCSRLFASEGNEYLCLKERIPSLVLFMNELFKRAAREIDRDWNPELLEWKGLKPKIDSALYGAAQAYPEFLKEKAENPWGVLEGLRKTLQTIAIVGIVGGVGYLGVRYVVPIVIKRKMVRKAQKALT